MGSLSSADRLHVDRLKAAGLALARACSRSSVSTGCVCGDRHNCVFFILRLTLSTVSWRALSWAKLVRKPSIFTPTTVSQVTPGQGVRYIWMCAIFGNSFEGCVYLGFPLVCGGHFLVGACECFCLHLYVITTVCEKTTLVSPMCFMYFSGVYN